MSNKEAVRKLFALLNNHKKVIAIIIWCLILSTGLNLCIPLISRRIMDDGFIGGNKELLIKLVLCCFLIYLSSYVIEVIKEKSRINISAKIQISLAEESFSHLMKMQSSYFNNKNYAEILNNINTDVSNMTAIADGAVFFVFTQAFSMVGGIIGLFIIDYRMTILVILFIPIKYCIMKHFAKQQKIFMDEFINDSQEYASWFGDTVGGVKEIKLFGIFDRKYKEFLEKQTTVIDKQKKLNMLGQWNIITDTMLVQFLVTMIYIVGANLVFGLQLSVGSVFAFITYSAYVTGPISAILNIGYLLSGIIPSTKRYYEFMALDEENENVDGIEPLELGDVEYRNVSFEYEKGKVVLDNVNFTLKQGSKLALIGQNGSGKSTVIDLLLRLYIPTSGEIMFDGKNISDMLLKKYRDMISVVSQDIYLFNDTIRNNICLYKNLDDSLILDACKDSCLHDFIEEVSLDYSVGQNGMMLSGGQKQKVALARALVHDKPIIIFDEATSNADVYSEQQINSLLKTKLKDKTVIVVTHRKEILKEVDQIVVLDNGEIADKGTYDELIERDNGFLDMLK